MQDLINQAAEMIRPYTFQLVNLSDAFEAGFKSGPIEYTKTIRRIRPEERQQRIARLFIRGLG